MRAQRLGDPGRRARRRLRTPTSTISTGASPVSGSYSSGGTSTRPAAVRTPSTRRSRSPARNAPITGPTLRRYGNSSFQVAAIGSVVQQVTPRTGKRRPSCGRGVRRRLMGRGLEHRRSHRTCRRCRPRSGRADRRRPSRRPTRSSRRARTGSRTTSRRRASGAGDHVGIYGLNSHEFVETILAAYKLRAVPINVNYRYVEAELRYLFDNADLVALVHDAQFAPRIAAVRDSLPMLRHLIAIDDGSGVDCIGDRLGPLRRRARRRVARARLRRAFRRRHLHPLHRRHHRACRRASCGGRKTCSACSAAASTSRPAIRVADEWEFAKAAAEAPTDAGLGIVIAPLMHGAAQWGTINGLINGARRC